jgi:hypothetical protein
VSTAPQLQQSENIFQAFTMLMRKINDDAAIWDEHIHPHNVGHAMEKKQPNWKTSGAWYSKTILTWEKKEKKYTFWRCSIAVLYAVEYNVWLQQQRMVMKEGKKTALNVKIEKLLFLFSWHNIFIAFSSATNFSL